eukprot:CAMPEP_0116913590 /NCGR_PEP_ID=MMETSP0467-20121206/16793_1 /TAXON_ID=283647 /ORGANISM="Mesodinium pulex, Strain SPMC105" /LENGTH=77 /DNA_ID=CAMNT_0004589831 /DNA_START=2791 /DNA_END=3024 /DNA_ORIENTATION=+
MCASMENIMSVVTIASKDKIEPRPNTFEVIGWDFMVDADLRVWLIECNRSPDLLPTTSVTKSLTADMFTDLAMIFCD